MDAAVLDVNSLKFSYQQIAYSAIKIIREFEELDIGVLADQQFQVCLAWMKPIYEEVLKKRLFAKVTLAPR